MMDHFTFEHDNQPLEVISPALKDLDKKIASNIKCVFVFGYKRDEVILVTTDDQVYCLGQNVKACLGLGHEKPVQIATKNDHLSLKKITKIAKCSEYSSLICLTSDGQIYGWGENRFGQIGDGTVDDLRIPKIITSDLKKKFIDVKCGGDTSMALTEDGEMYIWGNNNVGQVGDGTTDDSLTPKKVSFDNQKVISIHCTIASSFARLDNGKFFGWGYNGDGQLCLNHCDPSVLTPTLIKNLEQIKIKKIQCGFYHWILLDEDGNLFSCGYNGSGQLGASKNLKESTPQKIQMSKIKDILAFSLTSCCLLENGDVYVWGHFRGEQIKTPTKKDMHLSNIMNEDDEGNLMTFFKKSINA